MSYERGIIAPSFSDISFVIILFFQRFDIKSGFPFLSFLHTLYSTPIMSPQSHHITGAPAALDTAQPSPGQRSRFWKRNSSIFKLQD